MVISIVLYLLVFSEAKKPRNDPLIEFDPTWSRQRFIEETPASTLERLQYTQKHLIFKAGPPASGKTSALMNALIELGIADEPYMEINIDQFVMRNRAYKEQTEFVKRALSKIIPRPEPSTNRLCFSQAQEKNLNSPIIPPDISQLVCETDFMAYYKHRPIADRDAQALIFNEFLEMPHYRNMVYESTGSMTSYQFILKLARMARLHGFKVHIVYPVVRWKELIRRSELRALKVGRLVCPERIRQIRHESRWSLRDIIRKLDRPDYPIDSVLIINNDGKEGQMKKVCHFHKDLGRKVIDGAEYEPHLKDHTDL